MNLLIASYFCPTVDRSGGVQQVVGPLIDEIVNCGSRVRVAHPGRCGDPLHRPVPYIRDPGPVDHIEPYALCSWSDELTALSKDVDVILAIDRALPLSDAAPPLVLMCNSLAYVTEAHAAMARGWSRIIAPTEHLANQIRILASGSTVEAIPYGLPEALLGALTEMPVPDWGNGPLTVLLPHRPDHRKGHVPAIAGLASASRDIRLDISWLEEPRYEAFRQDLQKLSMSLGVADRVRFSGWVRNEARLARLADAHAVLQVGNFEESFGLSVVEAVLAGRIAITGPQPAVEEVLGTSPLHVEIDDSTDWALALISTVEELASGRGRPDGFSEVSLSISEMAQRYLGVLSEAATGHTNGG